MGNFLNRASVEIGATSGRTLSGIAMPWDRVAMVRDLIGGRPGPRYAEAFAPSSTDKTRSEHASFPVFVGHDPSTEPIGVVTFSRSHEALMFDAPLSKTPRADNYLELANDGAMRSVSIQFLPVKETRRAFPGVKQPVLYRTEVGLRHLALAPTGYGQYEDARVNAIRDQLGAGVTFAAQQDAVRDAIELSIGSQGLPDDPYVSLVDITDAWAVYSIEGGPKDEANAKRTLFRVEYTTADTGEVTLSAPVAVAVDYVPTGRSMTPILDAMKRRASRIPALPELGRATPSALRRAADEEWQGMSDAKRAPWFAKAKPVGYKDTTTSRAAVMEKARQLHEAAYVASHSK